jgi:hypothetical protein
MQNVARSTTVIVDITIVGLEGIKEEIKIVAQKVDRAAGRAIYNLFHGRPNTGTPQAPRIDLIYLDLDMACNRIEHDPHHSQIVETQLERVNRAETIFLEKRAMIAQVFDKYGFDNLDPKIKSFIEHYWTRSTDDGYPLESAFLKATSLELTDTQRLILLQSKDAYSTLHNMHIENPELCD